jgi:glycerate dehydrogenase
MSIPHRALFRKPNLQITPGNFSLVACLLRDLNVAGTYPKVARMKRPRLVILDAYATNPGDLSWAPIEALADCTFHDRTAPTDVLARTGDADAVMLNKAVLSAATIERASNLKYVGILATGWNTVDLDAAKRHSLVVTNVPGYSTDSVAQHTFAFMLELTNQVALHSADARTGGWSQNPDYCYRLSPLIELAGLTLGVVGFGQIGQAVARIGQTFGMRVLAHRRNTATLPPAGVEYVSLDRLFSESDVVSLHCPLSPATAGLVNAARLAQMKPSAFLVNTSRGPLIVERDLADALRANRIAGAAVDVLSTEPPAKDNPLLSAPRCVVTPHIAWATAAARKRLIDIAADNLRAFLAGQPIHQVPFGE